MTTVDDALHEWYELKKHKLVLSRREKVIKEKLHQFMNRHSQNRIVTENYICTRTIKTIRNIRKNDVEPELWEELSNEHEYPTLTIKKV